MSVGDESIVMEECLSKGVGFVVGEGRNVRFWLDDWRWDLYMYCFLGFLEWWLIRSLLLGIVMRRGMESLCGGCPLGEVSAL